MSNPPLNQLDSQQTTTASSQPPTLEMQPYVATINEDNMVSQIDAIIRRFLTRPNHQSPYWFTLDWNAPEGTNLDYTIRLIIHEPSIITMNHNSENKSHELSPVCPDVQVHESSQLLENQVVIEQQQQQQQQHEKKRKKKSRGNRQLQPQLTNDVIVQTKHENEEEAEVFDIDCQIEPLFPLDDITKNKTDQMNMNKRKRETKVTTTAEDTMLVKSFSQASISQPTTKKKCRSSKQQHSNAETKPNHTLKNNSDKTWKDLPDYLTVPDDVFKRNLLNQVTGDQTIISQWLEDHSILQYAWKYASLTNQISYLKMAENFMEFYTSTAMEEINWLSVAPKTMMTENNMNWIYCKTEKNIHQRRMSIQRQLHVVTSKLDEHLQQRPPVLLTRNEPTTIDINMSILSVAILAFVHKGQQRLRDRFQEREAALKLDVKDARLVQSFYKLNPTEEQIRSAKVIWQACIDEQKAKEEVSILKQRLSTQRLSPSYGLLDHSIDNLERILAQPGFQQDKRAYFNSSRQKLITQYKYQMMTLTIQATEDLKSLDEIADNEFQTIRSKTTACLGDHYTSASDEHAKEFFHLIKTRLYEFRSAPLSHKLMARAKHENQLVLSIQRKLKKANAIIRRTDKSKIFYICSSEEFEQKAIDYMKKTGAYQQITNAINPLGNIRHLITNLLDNLKEKKSITNEQWKNMLPNLRNCELPHLYFIPKVHKINVPLRPIMSFKGSSAINISKFLNDLLAPIHLRVARKTTYISGTDLIRQLENYRNSSRLQSTTLFIIFDVTDLYTMIPRDGALDALARFLNKYSNNRKIGNLSIDTILRLSRMVLDTNYFAYNAKYYKQIRGGAMGSPFTMVLANIYMLDWEQKLIEDQESDKELYGRYIDDVFMTTNLSRADIIKRLDEANNKDPNIKITYTVQSAVDFLDVAIENKDQKLITSVFHKPAAESCVLPFSSDHPRYTHRNTIYCGLLRAVRFCSDVYHFDHERFNFELTLIMSGYPLSFINLHFKRFFEANKAMNVWKHIDDNTYQQLHRKLLYQSTRN
ncbi:unnamed protein product [Rotaria magnacalcarata]|uniref:Reverse transcriptase domain-containing protein n=3 Tax=Rotaria magnacalcarata TaxID=392030 RepID=A0A816ARP7_9BILA|nr:unnamed protein product [Rotaria magnacalcarata]CAF4033392.1 unnamed protein product [Rotaria magnacalcarata]